MILVVDDDKSIRLSLKLILERNEFEVVLAEEPHAAIQGLSTVPRTSLVWCYKKGLRIAKSFCSAYFCSAYGNRTRVPCVRGMCPSR